MEINSEKIEAMKKNLRKGDVEAICRKARCAKATYYKIWRLRADTQSLTDTERRCFDAFLKLAAQRASESERYEQRVDSMVGATV